MELNLKIKNEEFKVNVETVGDEYIIKIREKEYKVNYKRFSSGTIELSINGKGHLLYYVWNMNQLHIHHEGYQYVVEEVEKRRGSAQFIDNILPAPMTGAIVKINNKEGDIVKPGTIIMIVEAMKMENELKAPYEAKIKKINGKVGDQVEGGKPLVELTPVRGKS